MNIKGEKGKSMRNNGITLIALVITIALHTVTSLLASAQLYIRSCLNAEEARELSKEGMKKMSETTMVPLFLYKF